MDLFIAVILGLIWGQLISHWGASILLHRYYCHKQFHVPKWFEAIGLFMLSVAYIRSPIGWIASHRMHHQYSDSPGDPHSPEHVGWWKVFTTTWDIPRIPAKYARDLYDNPMLVFLHKHHFKILVMHFAIAIFISFFIPYFAVAYVIIPFVQAKIGFGLINTLGHSNGPSNAPWINLFVAGEGYHKEHHDNWRRIRLHKFDTGGWVAEKLIELGIFKSNKKLKKS